MWVKWVIWVIIERKDITFCRKFCCRFSGYKKTILGCHGYIYVPGKNTSEKYSKFWRSQRYYPYYPYYCFRFFIEEVTISKPIIRVIWVIWVIVDRTPITMFVFWLFEPYYRFPAYQRMVLR